MVTLFVSYTQRVREHMRENFKIPLYPPLPKGIEIPETEGYEGELNLKNRDGID